VIPLLTPGSTLPESSGGSAGSARMVDEVAGRGVPRSASDAGGRDGPGRPADGTRFSAVLLALASIGTPFHQPPASAGLSSGLPRHEPVLGPEVFVGDEVAVGAVGAEDVEGADGDAPAGGREGVGGSERVDERDHFVRDMDMAGGTLVAVAPHPDRHATFADGDEPIADVLLIAEVDVVRTMPENASLDAGAADASEGPDIASGVVSTGLVSDTVTLDKGMLRRMSPEFVSRLERVAERMWNEHGARVDVVEGYRTQDRQEGLFAQGRTAEGPVVTWTTRSLHTTGAAADIYLDGGPVSPQQAVLLARVASEEGLRTLYPFDSGHIQLGGADDLAGPEGALPRRGPATPGQTVRPQTGVARVAPVARPARRARPGGMAMNDLGNDASPLQASGEDVSLPVERASPSSEGSQRSSVASPPPSPLPPATPAGVVAAPAADAPSAVTPQNTTLVADMVPVTQPADLSHLEAPDGPAYRRLHLPIDGLTGASLDIGVRPGSVDAMLNVSDPQLAGELRRSLHELRQVLSERGIDARGLAVRLVGEVVSEASSHQADAVVVRAGNEASTTGFSSDSKGGRQERFEERFEERPERRDHPSHSRDDRQKEGKDD